jgi:hypothetical protein
MSHISGFVQVGKAAPIGFRLVVGLRQQANALTDYGTRATWTNSRLFVHLQEDSGRESVNERFDLQCANAFSKKPSIGEWR